MLAACGQSTSGSTSDMDGVSVDDPITGGNWYQPETGTTWQWQLNETINTSYDVDVYDIDLFDAPEATIAELQALGVRVICYFSAGTYEDFRDDASEFPASVLGHTLEDHDDEHWLDVRSSAVLDIMLERLDRAVDKNCDGVEPDNVDGYDNNSGFELTSADQLQFNTVLANAAHEKGLSVGLKNDLDQIETLEDYYDFAVNEQCYEFDECDALQPFINAGKAVFNAEYDDIYVDNVSSRNTICSNSNTVGISTLILPIDLDDAFRLSCQ